MENKNHIDRQMLIKYLKGELSPGEAWKVEKAMLDDPFLAEAMEGLEMASGEGDLTDDLEELDRRINARDTKSGNIITPFFMRVAAAILVLTVSAFVIFELIHRNDAHENEIAMKKPVEKADTSGSAIYNDAGNAKADEEDITTTTVPENITTKKSTPPAAVPDKNIAAPPSEESKEIAGDNKSEPKELASGKPASGKVAGYSKTGPSDSSSIYSISTRAAAGNQNEALSPSIQAESRREKDKKMLQPAGPEKSQVIDAADELIPLKSAKAHPLPGDSAYIIYIRSRLRYPEEARNSRVQGDVYIQFTVKPDSSLQNVRVIKGIGRGCDEEAIRLISEGPKWVPAINNGRPVVSEEIYHINFSLK